MYTNQTLFDTAVKGFRAQNYQISLINTGSCGYRGKSNTKCLIGHCIPDAFYDSKIEGVNFAGLPDFPVFKLFEKVNPDFAQELQRVHDKGYEYKPEQFELQFRRIAKKYNLVYTAPQPTGETNAN